MIQLIFLKETNTAGLVRISKGTPRIFGRCIYVDESAAKEVRIGCGGCLMNPYLSQTCSKGYALISKRIWHT